MYPTFKDKEQIIAEKLSISLNTVKRGEIIIFKSPKEPDRLLIKRAIALPGETITINNGKVFINGNELDEPYLNHRTRSPLRDDRVEDDVKETEHDETSNQPEGPANRVRQEVISAVRKCGSRDWQVALPFAEHYVTDTDRAEIESAIKSLMRAGDL